VRCSGCQSLGESCKRDLIVTAVARADGAAAAKAAYRMWKSPAMPEIADTDGTGCVKRQSSAAPFEL
jgi:hypothetical protein